MEKTPRNIDKIGGLQGLNHIMTDFYKRIFDDPMIAYLFQGQNQQKLIDREVEWTARLLGETEIEYQGQSLKRAHSKHPIRRGHFFRRHQLLIQTLKQHQVPHEIQEVWLAHSLSLIHVILGAAKNDDRCEMSSQDPKTQNQLTPSGLWISSKE
jgi:hemoglobin